ncbi:MAG: hypothetical protein ACC648_00105 [Thiohalobacterales bacterium]
MKNSLAEPQQPAKARPQKSLSMHDGIAVWCDCCSCEMEPYWAAVAEEMGIDVYNDYEDSE